MGKYGDFTLISCTGPWRNTRNLRLILLPGWGWRFLLQCFGQVICLPAKEADMAGSNVVGINEMFRRLRSAKLSHVADTFIGK